MRCSFTALLSLLAMTMLAAHVSAQVPNQLLGVCVGGNASYYMRYGTWDCVTCPANARYSAGQCLCDEGFASVLSQPQGALSCESCASESLGVSLFGSRNGSLFCVPCGGANGATFGLANAVFSSASKSCVCPTNSVLVQSVGSVVFGEQYCANCKGTVVGQKCVTCEYPYTYSATAGGCICTSGYSTLVDGSCILQSLLSQLFSGVTSAGYQLSAPNIDNSGAAGSAVTSFIMSQYLTTAVAGCSTGNMTSCNLLANLCVISLYSSLSAPCTAYLNLLQRTGCRGLACEDPTSLPKLYYLRSGASILLSSESSMDASLNYQLRFVAAEYALNGTFLGNVDFTRHFFTCDVDYSTAVRFMKLGSQRSISCSLNLRWFLAAPQTTFFELFIRDPENPNSLIPIPVLIDYATSDMNPQTFGDKSFLRDAATDVFQPNANGYRRRFYLYDNVGSATSAGGTPVFVTYVRRAVVVLSISPTGESTILLPLVVLQYASFTAGPLLAALDTSLSVLRFQKVNSSVGDGAVAASTSVVLLMETTAMDQALMITLTVMCCLCFVSAWARTYGWMRRQQDLLVGPQSLIRFLIYLCNHVSNVLCAIVFLTCWYFYLFYKYQFSLEYSVPHFSSYIFNMLYAAVSAKGVVVFYRLVEQCNADIFVLDWERSKGQLLREEKKASVSMWRATFVANEFNEMQTLRRWNPLKCMLLIMLFLEGLKYMNLTLTVPEISFEGDASAPSNNILRIAVGSFFWFAVCVTLYVLQFHIYYVFFAVHPLREFVDLCSVSNISVMILLEPQWGFYIHGESIHAHADVSMVEFQENLQREARGDLPARGLGGQSQSQTFEVFIGSYLRNYLYACQIELLREMQGVAAAPRVIPRRQMTILRSVQQALHGTPPVFSVQTMHVTQQRNNALQLSVRSAEKSLLGKFGLHAMLDFPPNIMYMNGPFAGDNQGRDLYFFDDPHHFGDALLYGLDFEIFLLCVLLFVAIDTSLHNTFVSMAIVHFVETALVWYRAEEGEANLCLKSTIDYRFLI